MSPYGGVTRCARRLPMNNKTLNYTLLALVGLFALLYALGPVLTPFAIALVLAYLCNPIVIRLSRYITRGGAIALVYVFLTLLITIIAVVVLPLLAHQIEELITALPETLLALKNHWQPRILERMGIDINDVDLDAFIATLRSNWSSASGVAATVLDALTRSGKAIVTWLAILLLTPVLMFYFLRDWNEFWQRAANLLPRRVEPTVVALVRQIDDVLGAFLRGQLIVMSTLATLYCVGLSIIGLKYGILIGIVAGFLNFIPYLGVGIGVLVAVVTATLQFDSIGPVLAVVGVFGAGQALDAVFLTPLLVGERIGLHPVAVIFAVLTGGQLFGVTGVLIALPCAAAAAVLLRHAHTRYRQSKLYR